MSSDLVDVIKALIVVGVPAAVGLGWRAWLNSRRREAKLDQVIGIFEGRSADLIAGTTAEPGLLHRIDAITEQLHRNGGTTLRDAVSRMELQVDEIRVAQLNELRRAAVDRHRAQVVEELLRQHMRDGQILLATGQANDDALWAALRAAGIPIADPIPLPDVTFVLPADERQEDR